MGKKIIGLLIMAIGLTMFLSTSGFSKTIVDINFASDHAPDSLDGKIIVEWLNEVEQATNGRVKGTFFAGGALGRGPEIFNLVKTGAASAGSVGASWTKDFPIYDYLESPFKFQSATVGSATAYDLYNKGYLNSGLKDLKLVFLTSTAPFHLFSRKPVTNLNDLKGMKIRVGGVGQVVVIKALGGIPVSIPPSEVYMAMEKQTIDGIVTSMGLVEGFRLWEVIDYALWESFGVGVMLTIMNEDLWNKIPPGDQKIIEEINLKTAKRYTGYHSAVDKDATSFLESQDVKINYLADDEKSEWDKIAWDAKYKSLIEGWSSKGLSAEKMLQDAKAALEKASK